MYPTLLKKINREHFSDPKIGLSQTAVTWRKIIADKKLKKHFKAWSFSFNAISTDFLNLFIFLVLCFKKAHIVLFLKIFDIVQLDKNFFFEKSNTSTKKYIIFPTKRFFYNFSTIFLVEYTDFEAKPVLLKNIINTRHGRKIIAIKKLKKYLNVSDR